MLMLLLSGPDLGEHLPTQLRNLFPCILTATMEVIAVQAILPLRFTSSNSIIYMLTIQI